MKDIEVEFVATNLVKGKQSTPVADLNSMLRHLCSEALSLASSSGSQHSNSEQDVNILKTIASTSLRGDGEVVVQELSKLHGHVAEVPRRLRASVV